MGEGCAWRKQNDWFVFHINENIRTRFFENLQPQSAPISTGVRPRKALFSNPKRRLWRVPLEWSEE